jgi:purine-binding chemotaxis protein CheW
MARPQQRGGGELTFATEESYLRATDQRESKAKRGILAFSVGQETYGIEIEHIREIIKVTEMTEVPRAPRFLIGVISVRGVIIPVIDLRVRLHLHAPPPGRSARILVVMREGDPFGLLCDAVHGVVRLADDEIEPPPSTLQAGEASYLAGIGRQGGMQESMVILLNLDTLVDFEILARVARRQAKEKDLT